MVASYYYDSFDRTGSSLGTTEAPWTEDSGAWETVGGAQAASKGSGGRAALNLGSKNQWLEFDWTIPNANELPEVNVRSTDGTTSGSYYKLRYFGKDFGDGASVSRVVSGTATSLGYNGPLGNTNATKRWNFLVWDQDASTTRIQVYCDGSIVHEYFDTTSRLTSGDYMFIQHSLLSPAAVKFEYMTARAAEAESSFPQSASLKGQWRLNEASGANNAVDDSGNSHNLTYHGSPGSGTGIESTCRLFDGTNDYFTHADHADFSPTSKFTFAAWCYRTQTTICLASKWNYDVGADGWALQPSKVYVGTSTEFNFVGPGTNGWDLIVLVVDMTQATDAEKVQIYANGVKLTKTGSPTVALNDNADDFAIGYFPGLGRAWNGKIDLAHYWKDVALTQAEVRDLFNAGLGLAYSAATPAGFPFFRTRVKHTNLRR